MKINFRASKIFIWSALFTFVGPHSIAFGADPAYVTPPGFPAAPNLASPTAVASYPYQVADAILNTLVWVGFPISVIAILYSAYTLITSNGNPDAFTKVKKNLGYLIIGFILISIATSLVIWVRNIFGGII